MRLTFIRSIQGQLTGGMFRAGDFELHTEAAGGLRENLTITYRYDARYKIRVTIGEEILSGTMTPGEIAEYETFEFADPGEFIFLVGRWTSSVEEELRAAPHVRMVEQQAEEIEKIVQEMGEMRDEFFTYAQADELRARLDRIEKSVEERLEQAGLEQAELERKITELHMDIVVLKSSLASHKKPGWMRSYATRATSWFRDSENRALLKDGAEVVTTVAKMLGPGGPTP